MKTLKIIVIIIIFLLGLYFICKYTNNDVIEGFTLGPDSCPNILVQDGAKFFLYNTKRLKIPGVNPIPFNNLEDYSEFIEWQRSQNIRCPILYLQKTVNTQGAVEYRKRPSPFDTHGGISPEIPVPINITAGIGAKMNPNKTLSSALAEKVDVDFDSKSFYAAYDPASQYIGEDTTIDKIYHDTIPKGYDYSTNPMDPKWGGPQFTQKFIDSGYFADDGVFIQTA